MAEARKSVVSNRLSALERIPRFPPSPLPVKSLTLSEPSKKRRGKSTRAIRVLFSLFRTLPVFTPECNLSTLPICLPEACKNLSSSRVTGTLFGYRKGRVSLSFQENPKCLPSLIIELAIQTHVLLREISSVAVRIALECEKRHDSKREAAAGRLLDEGLWSMFCNGKKTGYGVKRDTTDEDIRTMEHLRAVSMGAGLLPVKADGESSNEDIAYLRSSFEHVVGSRDSETLYMISPDGNNGPDLTVFFVRI